MLNTLVYKKETNMFNASPIDYLLVNWNIINPDVYITNIKYDNINDHITFDVYVNREVLCFKLLLLSSKKERTCFELSCLNQEINDDIANLIVKYNADFVAEDYNEMNEFIKLKNITNYGSSSNLLIQFLNRFNDEFEAFEQSDSDSDTNSYVFKDLNETTININMKDIPKSTAVAPQLDDNFEQYNTISVKEELMDDVEDIWGDDDDFKKNVDTNDIFFWIKPK